MLLEIKNLHARVEGSEILRGVDLVVGEGEVHAVMGPNGSGKSTLARVLVGDPSYEVSRGGVRYDDGTEKVDLLQLSVEMRARGGVFLGFQYPTEITGLSNAVFLRSAYNAVCEHQGREMLDPLDFDDFVQEKAKSLKMEKEFVYRSLNANFSGGEKKRNEILQMAVLNPKLAILDEIDSGLDIDALKTVADGINALRAKDKSLILITHYHRILDFVLADMVHVMTQGRIVASGDLDLAKRIEKEGYENIGER